MGVWIETYQSQNLPVRAESHPSWVCGLKHNSVQQGKNGLRVTPFVGVWIETGALSPLCPTHIVTPFVGVWIETDVPMQERWRTMVTPFVGVWIETLQRCGHSPATPSHPSWVCGLKLQG